MMTKEELKKQVDSCVDQIRKVTDFTTDIALVLGSGLGAIADEIDAVATVDYHDIDSSLPF